ncbi:MAG TPA: CpsB/CapC family capsule biosynthesis tyrosine phosphatase [Chitinophagaceae bacterium]|nr:CpsB/CapC family capsule biosynthesis tyrosine phosphatase [Chitinophagaceae bacterium]
MISFFKRRFGKDVDFSPLGTDMHSHLLPGIDDGSPDVATSDELIKGLQSLGYGKLITTPHVISDLYPNNTSTISAAYQKLKSETKIPQASFPVEYAAEYMLDENFDKHITDGSLLCIKEKYVLVEFSFISPPPNFKQKLFELQLNHYTPVLAHPERYLYFLHDKQIFEDLRSHGCLFAVNLLSFLGYYGKPTAELANYFLKKNYIELLGTDLHHPRHLEVLRNGSQLSSVIGNLTDSGNLLNPRL